MTTLLEKSSAHLQEVLSARLSPSIHYHNLQHTLRVVKSTKELMEHSQLSDDEQQMLLQAAWWHDAGYLYGWENHEEQSSRMAADFLSAHGASDVFVQGVQALILATRITHQPQNLLEEIIRDADCSHMGSEQYPFYADALRKELEEDRGKVYTDEQWRLENIRMLGVVQRYHTGHALSRWQPVKERNLKELLDQQKKALKKFEKAKSKDGSSERAAQTLFRVTLQNHLDLSSIADTKANILLSVNAIIISLALSTLIPKLDSPSNQHLIIPTLVLMLFSVLSIIFAIMSTRPNVSTASYSQADLRERKVNLLFFGNFHRLPYEEFESAMNDMIRDTPYMYNSMTKDLYYLGKVLARKYKLLRITYTIFLIGIIASVVAFLMAFLMLEPGV